MTHTIKLIALALLAVGIASCKKDSDDPATPSGHEHHHATVGLALEFRTGEHTYTLDSVLTDGSGHKVKLDKARFFVSNVHLIDDAGVTLAEFPDAYLLANAGSAGNSLTLGELEVAHVHAFVLALGLDSATNHSDPTLFDTPPLNDASMHWSWNPDMGYKFMELEGRVDDDGDGVVDDADPTFLFHCAGDDLLTADTAHAHHTLVEGEVFTLPLLVRMDQLFTGIDVTAYPMEMGTTTATRQVMQDLATALDSED